MSGSGSRSIRNKDCVSKKEDTPPHDAVMTERLLRSDGVMDLDQPAERGPFLLAHSDRAFRPNLQRWMSWTAIQMTIDGTRMRPKTKHRVEATSPLPNRRPPKAPMVPKKIQNPRNAQTHVGIFNLLCRAEEPSL